MQLSDNKLNVMNSIDKLAGKRDRWIKRNKYYYDNIINFLKFNIREESSVLEIGCGTGYLLNGLDVNKGVGIDVSNEMIKIAQEKYQHLRFIQMDAENIELDEKFDFIIISDTVGYFEDVQRVFEMILKISHQDTRIIITYQNFLWLPIFNIAEFLNLKMKTKKLNWLNLDDISNLLQLSNFDIIKKGRRFLLPIYIPFISWLFNKYISQLPIFNLFCITEYVIARPLYLYPLNNKLYSVSVIIPARNEKGNIENAVKRIPDMGRHTEVIFVEGNSIDETYDEIKHICEKYSSKIDLKYIKQDGKGKGDAVRKGFTLATGDILMILDADLTVPPEDLTKFYNAITTGKGEYINGSRLVYPMEKEAMRLLNILGNKFFSIMFSWLLGQRLKDTLCGTKVISKKNWDKLVINRKYFGDFDPFGDFDLIFGASKLNLKIVEVPIRYKAREYGDTNISRFKHGWLLLKMVLFAMGKIKFI